MACIIWKMRAEFGDRLHARCNDMSRMWRAHGFWRVSSASASTVTSNASRLLFRSMRK